MKAIISLYQTQKEFRSTCKILSINPLIALETALKTWNRKQERKTLEFFKLKRKNIRKSLGKNVTRVTEEELKSRYKPTPETRYLGNQSPRLEEMEMLQEMQT